MQTETTKQPGNRAGTPQPGEAGYKPPTQQPGNAGLPSDLSRNTTEKMPPGGAAAPARDNSGQGQRRDTAD